MWLSGVFSCVIPVYMGGNIWLIHPIRSKVLYKLNIKPWEWLQQGKNKGMECPKCHRAKRQNRAEKTGCGSQR
jgi:hypothetical protein